MVANGKYDLTMPNCKILILRVDACSRLGLAQILSAHPSLDVKDSGYLSESVTSFRDYNPDVVIADYQSLVHSNFKLREHILNYYPRGKLLITSKEITRDIAIRVFSCLSGLYHENGDMNKLLLAVSSTFLGSIFVDPVCSPFLSGNLLLPEDFYPWDLLKEIEMRAVQELLLGKEYLEISEILNVSRPTVGNYIGAAIRKLNLNNRTELIVAAANCGLLNVAC